MKIDLLIKTVKKYNDNADIDTIIKAYKFAKNAHSGQQRVSGESYIFHPIEVAIILAELGLDTTTITAALLHDVVEDTGFNIDSLVENFGEEVALIVDGVTKLSRLEYKTKEEQQAENLRKMFLAMAKDIRVIMIKLADRLHNMRTLKYIAKYKQQEKSKETLEIFAPLAHRLGISKIQWELQDLALKYLDPYNYNKISTFVSQKKEERNDGIDFATSTLKDKIDDIGVKAEIQGRIKNFYSIFKKMKDQGKSFEQIYDLTALRVIVDTVKDCYGVLGIIHTLWKPIPGRFKDYIAMPKPNMYQSLHTTVIDPNGVPLEIQIRTWEMHKTAEFGIAAHWKYKESGKSDKDFEKKLSWLRELLEWQKELKDAREFMETLKIDLFTDEVFVFTPKGDVIDLPSGSTPIDFAYKIHTDIGNKCVGAKVNGKLVTLNYNLKNGDIVEIQTSKASGPSRDWLTFVKSSQARNKIRQWFKKEKREENVIKGKEMLERETRRAGYSTQELYKAEFLTPTLKKFNFNSQEDMFSALGFGGITTNQVIQKLISEYKKEIRKNEKNDEKLDKQAITTTKRNSLDKGVKVKGIDNIMLRFSKCCNPVPGDKILGYITRGRGVSIHRYDCPNIIQHIDDKERFIEVEWDESKIASYNVEILISAYDRASLLSDVINELNELKTMIHAINARTTKDNRVALINMTIEINNKDHLELILKKMKKIHDVYSVKRILPS